MNRLLRILMLGFISTVLFGGCRTAENAAEGATDVATHAVEKTGHAVAHGAQKIEKHL